MTVSSPNFPEPRSFRAVLQDSRELAPEIKHLTWEVVEGGPFGFLAGQFISMRLQRNGEELTHPYSLASAPRGDSRFDLCLSREEGSLFSNCLCDLAPGATVEFTGPHGFFVLQPPIEQDLVFIATGTGIAPIRGMLADLFARGLSRGREVWLLFGAQYPHTILYGDEFEQLARDHTNFHFIATLSRPSADWNGATGYVQHQLRRRFAGRRDFAAYVCGLKAMVDDVRTILTSEFGLDLKRIHYEKYD